MASSPTHIRVFAVDDHALKREGIAALIGNQGYVLSRLLLIWLTQQTTMRSVKGCLDRHFPRPCDSFKANSPPRKPANNTSRAAIIGGGSVPVAATKSR